MASMSQCSTSTSNLQMCLGYLNWKWVSSDGRVAFWCPFLSCFPVISTISEPSVGCGTSARARPLASLSTSLSIVPPFIMCVYLVMRASSVLTRNLLGLKTCSTLLNEPQRKLDKYIPPLPRMLTKALATVSQFHDQLHQHRLLGTLNGYGPMFELQDGQLAKTTYRLHRAADNQQQCKVKIANLVYSSIPKSHRREYVFWIMFSSKIHVLLLERNPGSK